MLGPRTFSGCSDGRPGVLAALVDLGKGLLAAGAIATLRLDTLPAGFAFWQMEAAVRLLAGVAAIIGHIYPVWAGFRGGKGVNTAAGVLFALTPATMGITLGIFLIVLLSSRYVSLASLSAAAAFPSVVAIRRYVFDIDRVDPILLVFGIAITAGIVVAHRTNIRRLFRGTENRIRSFRPAKGMKGRGEL